MIYKLIVVRHGQSEWNLANKFTGWTDVDITEKGSEEAKNAGKLLKKHGFEFDMAYTSVLKRAIKTLNIILEETDHMWIPVMKNWRWNERHYGDLQGFNKQEMAEKVGKDQVHMWRRSFSVAPPALKKSDPRYSGNERKYSDLSEEEIPLSESLKDTIDRFIPLWDEKIVSLIKEGKRLIISAHGNTIRSLAKHLENIPDEEIVHLEIPTGVPIVYEIDTDDMSFVKRYFLEG